MGITYREGIADLRHVLVPVAVAAALAAGSVACTRPAHAAPRRAFIVGLRDDASTDGVADERARRGTRIGARMRWAFRGFVASMSDDEARELAGDPRVGFVEPDLEVLAMAQSVSTGIGRIGALGNDELQLNGVADGDVDVDVAVIDSGVDLDHPDLNVAPGVNCTGGTCRAGGDDDNGHGTHVAGIIGARDNGDGVVGAAPGARIVPVKSMGARREGLVSDVVLGLEWVAANSDRIEVANLSIGARGTSRALTSAVSNVVNRGVVVVVAAGNETSDARAFTPASHPDVITVSAVSDYDGAPGGRVTRPGAGCVLRGADDRLASYSNYGSAIDVAAPGTCILSLWPGGRTRVESGTSMAAPFVAGAAALLASQGKPADRSDVLTVRSLLQQTGTYDWTDTRDGVEEPLLNVSDAAVFAPVLVDGPAGV